MQSCLCFLKLLAIRYFSMNTGEIWHIFAILWLPEPLFFFFFFKKTKLPSILLLPPSSPLLLMTLCQFLQQSLHLLYLLEEKEHPNMPPPHLSLSPSCPFGHHSVAISLRFFDKKSVEMKVGRHLRSTVLMRWTLI